MDISDNSNSIQTKITTTCDALFIFEPFNLSGWLVLILMWVSIDVLYPSITESHVVLCCSLFYIFFITLAEHSRDFLNFEFLVQNSC